jgi:23S rRNA pseudouridine1911/1915/1917 synthase
MSPDREFEVRPSNDGVTLSAALRKVLGDAVSWSAIKAMIAGRRVQLNGNLCVDEGRRVKKGDRVRVFEHARAGLGDVVIRYADEHLVIIDKPAGVNTLRHREERDFPQARKDLAPTAEELTQRALAAHLRGSSNPQSGTAAPRGKPAHGHRPTSPPSRGAARGVKPHRGPHAAPIPTVRAVHRLDRDTSGLMLFALTPAAEQALERDFARHAVERKYRAVVWGDLKEPRTIESWLVRDRGDGLRGSSPKGPNAEGAQRALTRVRPIERLGPFTLVECELETGRTHQIRIHLSEAGHPLAGEKIYTHSLGQTPWRDPSNAPRQALHSATLSLTHPATSQRIELKSDWPKEMAAWIKKLGSPAAKPQARNPKFEGSRNSAMEK